MHNNQQQLWSSWAAGEIDDDTAQAAAEAAHAKRGAGQCQTAVGPQNAPAPAVGAGRGYRRREKVFGPGRCVPLDRNAKVRVMMLARALMRRREAGRHYGEITAKFVAVLEMLVQRFHNASSGKCFPSYETLAEAAGCSRTSVYHAIRALEQVGLLSWVHRLVRVREACPGLFGAASAWRWRVFRTSNAYVISDPASSKFNFCPGTSDQDFKSNNNAVDNQLSALQKKIVGDHGPGFSGNARTEKGADNVPAHQAKARTGKT
jgi:Helix-turn-helix domain